MAGVRLGFLCLLLAGMLLVQPTSGNAEAPAAATAKPLFVARIGDAATSKGKEEHPVAEAPEIRKLGNHHFHKSMAGGGVVIGGLATAVFAVVFCYIRVTRKPNDVN